jgi:hypothetical protein
MAMAAEMDAVSFMVETFRTDDWELTESECLCKLTHDDDQRRHLDHPGCDHCLIVSWMSQEAPFAI